MFLHFHGKYNMILFVLQIPDHIQIKTFFLSFLFYNLITYIKKVQTHTRIPFYYVFLIHPHLHVTNH